MIKTIQININSADGILLNGSKKSDVYFNFKNILINEEYHDYIDFYVSSIQIPVSFYNITNDNNRLNWNGTILTITPGNYNTTSLSSEIINQLSINGISTVSIVLSNITGKYTFTDSTADFTLFYATSTIFKILGFTEINQTSSSYILTSEYPVNLLGALKLKITSQDINIYNVDSKNTGSTNTLIEIPVSASNFGLILYNNISNIHGHLNQKILNGFDIKIQSDTGNLMDFNNIDWTMSFLLKIYLKPKTNIKSKTSEPSEPSEPSELTDDEILLNNI